MLLLVSWHHGYYHMALEPLCKSCRNLWWIYMHHFCPDSVKHIWIDMNATKLISSVLFAFNSLADMLPVNTLRPRHSGRYFADDTFKRILLSENARISIKISLKFVPMGPINNIPAMVQIMAWRRPGDKPLSEPLMVRLPTRIYASLGLNELKCPKQHVLF